MADLRTLLPFGSPFVFLGAIGVGSMVTGLYIDRATVLEALEGVHPLSYLAFCGLAAVLLVPGAITKSAVGLIFGPSIGVVLAFAGAMVGTFSAFVVARRLARVQAIRRGQASSVLKRFDSALKDRGLRFVFLLRLSPLVPFNVLNYALGLSSIRFRDAFLGGIGMLPTVAVYAYGGATFREMLTDGQPSWEWFVLVVGVLASGLVVRELGLAAKNALEDSTESS